MDNLQLFTFYTILCELQIVPKDIYTFSLKRLY